MAPRPLRCVNIRRSHAGRALVVGFAVMLGASSRATAQSDATKEPPVPPSEATPAPASAPPNAPHEETPAEFSGVVAGGTVVSAKSAADVRPWTTQRNFALVASEGSHDGFGLGIRTGWARLGVDGSFAFMPLLATFSPDPESFPEFKLLTSFQVNAGTFIGLYRPGPRSDLGIALAYKYNSLMRHGASVAFYFQYELGAHWVLLGFAGPSIFPAAEDHIREKTGWKNGSVLSGMAAHQAGLGLSIAFFP